MKKGFTVWLTGLPGSGKSTIAASLAEKLNSPGRKIELLDSNRIGNDLGQDLRFNRKNSDSYIHRLGFIAHLLTRNKVGVICASISPYKKARDKNRRLIGDFIEVYVKVSHKTCEVRIVKGLDKGAQGSGIKDLDTASAVYEAPDDPEIICDTETETVEESTQKIIEKLQRMDYLAAADTSEKDDELLKRLKGLGYL